MTTDDATRPAHDDPRRAQAIRRLLAPRSVAIVGASSDLSKINGRPLKHLLDKRYGGRIYPVNPKYPRIAGVICYPEVAALPETPDLAVIVLPAREVPACIEALGARGVPAAVIFSSGFGEMGEAGRAAEAQLVARARHHGIALCGPNCLGLVNGFDHLYATFSQYADGPPNSGAIAFVTQSGAFGTAIAALARERGLGLGYFVNTGNEADLGFAELMDAAIEDPRIRIGAGYLEGVRDGAALVRLARRCQALGKPLVLTKVGRKAAGARAAASHTGALAVEDTVFDAVVAQYGVLRARNEEQMIDMLEALSGGRRARGNGLGIATQSGGAGVMMADRAEEVGLAVPALAPATRERLAAVMPAFGAVGNPVDVTGQFVATPGLMRASLLALLEDPAVDIGIVWLQLMHAHAESLVRLFTEIHAQTDKPLLVCWVAAPVQALAGLRAAGIPVFGAGERAVEAAAALARSEQVARLPFAPAEAPAPDWVREGRWIEGVQPSVAAVRRLADAGIPMAPVALARDEDEALARWRGFGGPVALKIESPDITHKTEVGGVVLGIDGEAAVREGFRTLVRRAGEAAPGARLDGVLVQPMAAGHLELVVGVKRDPLFGMVVMVGLGGILVEVLEDVVFGHAPVAEDEALRMLARLKGAALLDGVRGQPAVDRQALARMLARLSHWAASVAPALAELDLNPVRVGVDGPVGVDCVMVFGRCDARGVNSP
jgi:acetyltransferase